MSVNDFASIILWLIVAVFILHVIEGDAKEWVVSKFSNRVVANKSSTPSVSAYNPPTDPETEISLGALRGSQG